MKRFGWIVLVLLLAVSCGTTVAPADPTPAPTSKGFPPVTSGASGPVVIDVERTGGIAGKLQWWRVYATGQVQLGPEAKAYQFRPEDVDAMIDQLADAGFFDLKDSYGSANSCNDCYLTKVTVFSEGRTKTVAIVEGSSEVPANVTAMFTQIMSWLSNIPQ